MIFARRAGTLIMVFSILEGISFIMIRQMSQILQSVRQGFSVGKSRFSNVSTFNHSRYHRVDADIHALGVDAAGRKKSDWVCAREFWMKYFAEAGANLREYSLLGRQV
jgi:hypothetical protein